MRCDHTRLSTAIRARLVIGYLGARQKRSYEIHYIATNNTWALVQKPIATQLSSFIEAFNTL